MTSDRTKECVIGGREWVPAKLRQTDPAKLHAGERLRSSRVEVLATEEPQEERAGGTRPDKGSDLDVDVEFFPEFPGEGDLIVFASFALTAGKLPESGVAALDPSLTNEQASASLDQPGNHNDSRPHEILTRDDPR